MRIQVRGFAQGGGEGCQGRDCCSCVRSGVAVLRLEAAVPHGQQRPSLCNACPSGYRARRARIEVVVEGLKLPWRAIAFEDIWQRRAGERGQREAQEGVERGELRRRCRRGPVVREIRL